MLYTCEVCGRVGPSRRCARHPPRSRYEQQQFRQQVIARDQACVVCGSTTDLIAHHVQPLATKRVDDTRRYSVDNGITYCRRHHTHAHHQQTPGTTPQADPPATTPTPTTQPAPHAYLRLN